MLPQSELDGTAVKKGAEYPFILRVGLASTAIEASLSPATLNDARSNEKIVRKRKK
jgi:hypothetical protein